MHQGPFIGTGWTRGGASEVVRRAHPASGAQWNVQVVRGKVNGKCLWNACKALSLGLLLMVLGAAMATIGYYADHLSATPEFKGNFTFRTKNETKSFHLNNLSYAGPIVMGVGGFIVVAACVMTFEARDSAAKVVPARFKLSTTGPPSVCGHGSCSSRHSSLKTSAVQVQTMIQHPHTHQNVASTDRRALTQSFLHFSRGLELETQQNKNLLKLPQGSINRSPSAPDLVLERSGSTEQPPSPHIRTPIPHKSNTKPNTFAACALLNPGLLHRHALSVDETAGNFRLSNDSLHPCGSQGSMAMDLHLECPVTLRVKDKRRNPLKRQRRVDEEINQAHEENRRSSHSCSVKLPPRNLKDTSKKGGSAHQLPTHYTQCRSSSTRRSSNASDISARSRPKKRDCAHNRGKLERAISSDSRLTGGVPRYPAHYTPQRTPHITPEVSPQITPHPTRAQNSLEVDPGGNFADTEIRLSQHSVHFSNTAQK